MSNLIDIKDKNGNYVFFGDKFIAKMIEPSPEKGTLVTIVKNESPENLECGRNYDVEDKNGDRLWNAYMVIRNQVKINPPIN